MALLEVTDLVKEFPIMSGGLIRRQVGKVHAVSGVSFELEPGETLGLVGESGSGKSTTGRAVLQLHEPTSGSVRYDGHELIGLDRSHLRDLRKQIQMVFQDPYASLNPKMPVNDIVAEPFVIHHSLSSNDRKEKVAGLLRDVGLRPSTATGTRTSSRVVSVSGSASPARSRSTPGSSCSTSRCRRSTCRCRRG